MDTRIRGVREYNLKNIDVQFGDMLTVPQEEERMAERQRARESLKQQYEGTPLYQRSPDPCCGIGFIAVIVVVAGLYLFPSIGNTVVFKIGILAVNYWMLAAILLTTLLLVVGVRRRQPKKKRRWWEERR